MTENEATKVLYTMRLAAGLDDFEKPGGVPVLLTKEELADACKLAIKALGEVQQYREIGTLEECRAAVEKQTAKRALHQGCYDKNGEWHEWNGINGKPYELCPSCRANLCCEMPLDIKPKYCKNCGQKLNWRNENEML